MELSRIVESWSGVSGVQSVERAFSVLRCLAGGPAGVSAIAERVGLPKSTVSRLLSTLQDIGAVEQSGAGGDYRVGGGLVDIATGALPGRSLVAAARPHLAELVDGLDEVAGLSVFDVQDVVYVEQVSADRHVQVRDWTGERIPAHMVSSGLVLLANLDTSELERYLARPLEAATDRTVTDPEQLRARLATIARDGYVWTFDEYVPGISSVAAPVIRPDGRVLAAVHVHGPSYRFPESARAPAIAELVAEAGRRIGARLASADALASSS